VTTKTVEAVRLDDNPVAVIEPKPIAGRGKVGIAIDPVTFPLASAVKVTEFWCPPKSVKVTETCSFAENPVAASMTVTPSDCAPDVGAAAM